MEHFIPTGLPDTLPEGARRRVGVGGQVLVILRVEGQLYALEDRCPHRGGHLSEGDLAGHLLHCPLHAWPFDVRTGACLEHPDSPVRIYPVRVQDGEIHVGASATLARPPSSQP